MASNILEARFDDAQFHGTTRVDQNFGKLGCSPSPYFSVDSLTKVNEERPDSETVTFITKTMLSTIERESVDVVWQGTVTDEAASSMGEEAYHKEESEVMGVPEYLKCLMANLVMRSRVDEEHNKKHEMTSDATRLSVMDLLSKQRPYLSSLDVDEVHIVGSSVDHSPEGH